MAKEELKAEAKQKVEASEQYELTEIPTQTAVVIKNNKTGEYLNESQALALVLNMLTEVRNTLG